MEELKLGKKITSLRKKQNLTQEKLAEKIGVARQTIANWENESTSPDLREANLLSQIFKISLDELCNNEIECKDNTNTQVFRHLLNKTCYLTFTDDYFSIDINDITPIKILNVQQDFIKIEYNYKKKKITKLIDLDLIETIKGIEGEE